MDSRTELETTFLREILRIVGPSDAGVMYAVAPDTSDELLAARIEKLRAIPSGIGHEALMQRLAPERGDQRRTTRPEE